MALILVLAGVFGSLIGSFLNVVIHRLPRGMAMGMERSQCPRCGNQIAWYDNVPVISYLLLLGRCRACKVPISFRYPAVELITAVLFALCAQRTLQLGWDPGMLGFLVSSTTCAVLVAAAWIDWDTKTLPDAFTTRLLPVIGLVGAIAVPALHGTTLFGVEIARGMKPGLASLLVGLAGAAIGGGLLSLIRAAGSRIAGREAMGSGDVKLMAALGLLLGPVGMLLALGIGFVVGALLGLLARVARKDREIPFGPFLALGSVVVLLYRDSILELLMQG
ncbi:MAG: prepilin peptidase [Planctomycetota bacterium]|jgi:leader peptidase (prepilin peptidase)/N-methyltransferase